MKPIKFLAPIILLMIVLPISLQSCDKDEPVNNLVPEEATILIAKAVNLSNEKIIAHFNNEGAPVEIKDSISIGDYKYGYSYVLAPKELTGMPGETIIITYTPNEYYPVAIFKFPDSEKEVNKNDSTISYTLPQNMGDSIIVKASASPAIGKEGPDISGSITIYSTEYLIKKNLVYKDHITLTCGQSYEIPFGDSYKWSSSNEIIAYLTKDNMVKADLVGEAKISSSRAQFTVTVQPTSDFFKTPCIDWGFSISNVKSYMQDFELSEEETDGSTVTLTYNCDPNRMEEDTSLLFYLYTFENNKLTNSSMMFLTANEAYMDQFLNERYLYEGSGTVNDMKADFYLTPTGDAVVASIPYLTIFRMVLYFDSSALNLTRGTLSINNELIETVKKQVNNISLSGYNNSILKK